LSISLEKKRIKLRYSNKILENIIIFIHYSQGFRRYLTPGQANFEIFGKSRVRWGGVGWGGMGWDGMGVKLTGFNRQFFEILKNW
jgi:hypothetical protein